MSRFIVAVLMCSALVGCTNQQIEDLRAGSDGAVVALGEINEDVSRLEADLAAMEAQADTNPEAAKAAIAIQKQLAVLRAQAERWNDLAHQLNEQIQSAGIESGWDIAEAAIGAASVFFPAALIGIPLIRSLRRAFTRTVIAVEAGGGPMNPEATRVAMTAMDPNLPAKVAAVKESPAGVEATKEAESNK